MHSFLRRINSSVSRKIKKVIIYPVVRFLNVSYDVRTTRLKSSIVNSYVPKNFLVVSAIDKSTLRYLSSMYLSHRFDLLGSGWVPNNYTDTALGVEGNRYNNTLNVKFDDQQWLKKIVCRAHQKYSFQIMCVVDKTYVPIDWQKDFKSGYRWTAREWYRDQRIGHLNGVDVKVPWELARFQHLPQMAICALCMPEIKRQMIKEFKNQIIDFIAVNPPKMGVNWICSMDVGIRAANMLIAFDIFRQIDEEEVISNEFKDILSGSVYEHGRHIMANLENDGNHVANHYLANIAGLLFISAYLESSRETDEWLAFSIMELVKETERQFNDDGTNFETSTSYHRLSGEMVIYSIALICGLDRERIQLVLKNSRKFVKWLKNTTATTNVSACSGRELLPESVFIKMQAAGIFTETLTKPDGTVVQIGDNDSGRFFKLTPVGEFIKNGDAEKKYWNLNGYNSYISSTTNEDEQALYWDENDLDHSPFVSAVTGVVEPICRSMYKECKLEKSFTASLGKGCLYTGTNHLLLTNSIVKDCQVIGPEWHLKETVMNFPGTIMLTDGIKIIQFRDFGLVLVKSKRLYCAIRIGGTVPEHSAGHSHNDMLSFELNVDGDDVVVDAGTYLYSPLPSIRNTFRSTFTHNTICVDGIEQRSWNGDYSGLFRYNEEYVSCAVHEIERNSIVLSCRYGNVHHIRNICFYTDKVVIKDMVNLPFSVAINRNVLYSNGYGKLLATEMVRNKTYQKGLAL